jgi:hypothetical protein
VTLSTEHVIAIVGAILGALIGIVLRDHDRRVTKIESRQDLADSATQRLSEVVVKLTVLVEALQKAMDRAERHQERANTGSFQALSGDTTGSHKAVVP